jgi:hypothetical protein
VDRPHHLGQPVSEPAAAAEEPKQPEPRRYDLFLRHRAGLYWKLTDRGIVPGPEKLSYMQDGRWGFRHYKDIYSVNLSSAHIPRSGNLAQCGISFRNGATLGLSTASELGVPDASQREVYDEFIEDFHNRLVASGDAKRISFTRGGSEMRMLVQRIALIAGTALFVILPIVLAIMAHDWGPFQLMIMGGLFLWPAWQAAEKNQPGTYDPRYPPDMLD